MLSTDSRMCGWEKSKATPGRIPTLDCRRTVSRTAGDMPIASAKISSHRPPPYTSAWSKKVAPSSTAPLTKRSASAASSESIRMQPTATTGTSSLLAPSVMVLMDADPATPRSPAPGRLGGAARAPAAVRTMGWRRTITAMSGIGRLDLVAFDAPDTEQLANFYTELTGWQVVRNDGGWINIEAGDGQQIGLQPAPDHIPPRWPGQERPQQFHLDLLVGDRQAAADRAVALGATRLADGASWITLADPAGHPFDLCQRDGVGPAMELYAVTVDAPDAAALARFYAGLLGTELGYQGPEGALLTAGGKNLMFQQVSGYRKPQWPDPAHPQQAHLDIFVDDLDAGEALALDLGATVLRGGGSQFRTLADPAGHPFDLTL